MADVLLFSDSRVVKEKPLVDQIASFAKSASVEVNVADAKYLDESRDYLPSGTRIYVSHLPKQHWGETIATCQAVRQAGFEPVPHLPVRLLESPARVAEILAALRETANAAEILLISGDYPAPVGPYQAVAEVLETGLLERHGFRCVSLAGHPEGHPKVELERIRTAERDKVRLAAEHGLESRLVTQFLFEPQPFIDWVNGHQTLAARAPFVCGLAGPAKITTLMRYALRCGVGPSIRALGAHTSAIKSLIGDHGPDRMLKQLAQARIEQQARVDGIHMFCFGGFIRTSQWLARVAARQFTLNDSGGFDT